LEYQQNDRVRREVSYSQRCPAQSQRVGALHRVLCEMAGWIGFDTKGERARYRSELPTLAKNARMGHPPVSTPDGTVETNRAP
jgi:hypothetical protein